MAIELFTVYIYIHIQPLNLFTINDWFNFPIKRWSSQTELFYIPYIPIHWEIPLRIWDEHIPTKGKMLGTIRIECRIHGFLDFPLNPSNQYTLCHLCLPKFGMVVFGGQRPMLIVVTDGSFQDA